MSELSEFAQRYAERSGLTVVEMFRRGYRAYPCGCGEEDCEGFQMLQGDSRAAHELAEMLGRPAVTFNIEEMNVAWRTSGLERRVKD